jgi:peptidoglycan/LPS O-acetylase OafA/YrhL
MFAAAIATAAFLVRRVPTIRRTVSLVESSRHRAIDGLRGLLGVSVLIHHTVFTWYVLHGEGWSPPRSRLITHLGSTSVALFFMITAFLFWGRVLSRGGEIDWKEFLVSRIYRLYPVYLLMFGVVLILVILTTWPAQPPSMRDTARSVLEWLLMLDAPDLNGLANTRLLVAGVLWSLRYEWLFYLALPLIGLITGRSRQPFAAILSAMAAGALVHWWIGRYPFEFGVLLSFAGGVAAAHWVRHPELVAFGISPAAGVAALAALVCEIGLFSTPFQAESTVLLAIFFVMVACGQSFGGLLCKPALLWLGDITYGIYLLHGLLLWLLPRWLLPHLSASGIDPVIFLAIAVTIGALVVLLSSVVFLGLERPAILMGKRHYRWIAAAASDLLADRHIEPRAAPSAPVGSHDE